eukprot:1098475-Prymnesium_polylepis.1
MCHVRVPYWGCHVERLRGRGVASPSVPPCEPKKSYICHIREWDRCHIGQWDGCHIRGWAEKVRTSTRVGEGWWGEVRGEGRVV